MRNRRTQRKKLRVKLLRTLLLVQRQKENAVWQWKLEGDGLGKKLDAF